MADTKHPGRWRAGSSGNPKGRPPGTGQVAKFRAAIAERVPELLTAMMERALAGDTGAARLVLERTVPPLRAADLPEPLNLPDDGSLTEQGQAIVRAIAKGELAPAQGAQLLVGLRALARVREVDELSARLDALEGKTT